LFLFRSKSGSFIKVLWWDGDGFAIFAKRLEVGTFQFPDVRFVNGEYAPVEIERRQFAMLLEGIDTVDWYADVLARINGMKTTELQQLLPQHWSPPQGL
jgi:transposase